MTPPASDTIVAIATPPGRGALALVRLSGPQALTIAARLARPFPDEPRVATLCRIVDGAGTALDEAIVVAYHAPASFTGEDCVEVTCHGGAMTPATIAAAFVSQGARPAEPGEFTRRAVLNGKLDILQAEAIGDLVDAPTRAAHAVALAQLDGGLSRRITSLRDAVVELEALCAYDIDFPEEDDGPIPRERVLAAATKVEGELGALLATAPMGEIVREGAVVVLAGAPNVGKSSLFNALLGRRRAIVTDVPGTTRDALEAVTEAGGWPVRLIDTAGLRESNDAVEKLGIEVSREYLERAHVVLACGDSDASLAAALAAASARSGAAVIPVRTKSDRGGQARAGAIAVSAQSGEGLATLTNAIAAALSAAQGALALDAPLITRERHRIGIARAQDELRQFHEAWSGGAVPAVVAAVHLRAATRELEEIVGAVDVEDVLDRLFSAFCVGK
ncbi:MAG TPA: tRNA uridine-5-carboxymethylaminomethyl(34) synthesis GTPase MnmE [Gemmatimonadaceae bacterium]|nr:tRNA uridine-5-carboxymethylaminomethyl(34) synthesis GTPase MnmE [Gemmatimonadaceae bacterium]